MMHFFALVCTGVIVYIVAMAVLRAVRNLLPSLGIRNEKARRLVVAGITSGIAVSILAIAETLLATPFSLSDVAACFGLLTVLEYFSPSLRA